MVNKKENDKQKEYMKKFVSVRVKKETHEKIGTLKKHPNQRYGEVVEDLVDEEIERRKK